MADTGEHAFSLALAVLGDPAAAEDVALMAVRRGGRSRVATLAFTRHLSLARARQTPPDPAAQPRNVVELALALAATRPPLERALVDLAGRHHLDRAALGRTVGLTAAAAAERAAAVTEQWTRELDPALMAWLGPGDCPDLAAVLAANGLAGEPVDALTVTDGGAAAGPVEDPDAPAGSVATTTATATSAPAPALDGVLAVAPAVAAHVSSCEVCTDRTRAMVSVPALVGGRPLDPSPEAVRAASRRNRFRPPAPLPPAIDATGRRSWIRAAPAAAAAIVVVALAAGAVWSVHRSSSRHNRVAALTRLPGAGSGLTLSPKIVRASDGAILVRNESHHTLHWHAAPAVHWLTITPSDGVLTGGSVVEIDTHVETTAPEGNLQAAITITGDDGSAAAAVVETTVEHPPTLTASVLGCLVTATADDEGTISSVVLHWRDGKAERVTAMTAGPANDYTATLPLNAARESWWVTAVDNRGNRAQTPEQPAPSC